MTAPELGSKWEFALVPGVAESYQKQAVCAGHSTLGGKTVELIYARNVLYFATVNTIITLAGVLFANEGRDRHHAYLILSAIEIFFVGISIKLLHDATQQFERLFSQQVSGEKVD